jgi:hypothetical protein
MFKMLAASEPRIKTLRKTNPVVVIATIRICRWLCATCSGVLGDQVFQVRTARLLHHLLPGVIVHVVMLMNRLLPSGCSLDFTMNINLHRLLSTT